MEIQLIPLLTILIAILMNVFFKILPIIVIIVPVARYIQKLPEKRKNKLIQNQILQLYDDVIKADEAKQYAQIVGENTRNNITNIVRYK